jgi:hypothetical protein
VDVVLEQLEKSVAFQVVKEGSVEVGPQLLFALLFGFFALGELDVVLVLSHDIEVVGARRKQGKNDAEGMLFGVHGGDKLLDLGNEHFL